MPRIFCPVALHGGAQVELPAGAARHVQVLRMQPGELLTLFDGRGGEYQAEIERMSRSGVRVKVGAHDAVEREAPRSVRLAVGMPANERMDWLVEKATELGVAAIQPLVTQHSVLRLAGERAEKKRAHWQGVAEAACEQCGRNRVPEVNAPQALEDWLPGLGEAPSARWLLSPAASPAVRPALPDSAWVLSGPEGGLSAAEEQLAQRHGFAPVSLGARILRAETAPLAALALFALSP